MNGYSMLRRVRHRRSQGKTIHFESTGRYLRKAKQDLGILKGNNVALRMREHLLFVLWHHTPKNVPVHPVPDSEWLLGGHVAWALSM